MTRNNLQQCGMQCACLLLILSAMLPLRAKEGEEPATPAITNIPQESTNIKIVDQLNSHYILATLDPPVYNWFAGTFTNLPTDKDVTIGLSMDGMDSLPNKADVSKWVGLRPVMTYADPAKYETYEWFRKDGQGRWISGDPFKLGEAAFAGTGKVPDQTVIPKELADQFLSADGSYWQAWREIEKVETLTSANIFRIKAHFARPTATVAMRIPYPTILAASFIQRLKENKPEGITIYPLGLSEDKHELAVVAIGSVKPSAKRPVMLLYGAEDGDEPDSAWAAHGFLAWLISDNSHARAIRERMTVLIVIQLDPDGAASSTYARITNAFTLKKVHSPVRSEVLSYCKFISDWISSGHRLDLVCALHNVECNEGQNLFCPVWDVRCGTIVDIMNQYVLSHIQNVAISRGYWGKGFMSDRLSGFCFRHWGSIMAAYEMNSRYPDQRLTLAEIQDVGSFLGRYLCDFINTAPFITVMGAIDEKRLDHLRRQDKYYQSLPDPDAPRTAYQIMTLGF